MIQTRQIFRFLRVAALLCAFGLPGAARAQVDVTPTLSLNNGLYHYDYTITNNASLDLLVVTTSVFSLPDAVQNPTTPTGFKINFDSGLGLVDFISDTQTFAAGTTVSGFAFDSPFTPNLSSFDAVALDTGGNPVHFTGSTLAPADVPEPGAFALALVLAPELLLLRRRCSGRKRQ